MRRRVILASIYGIVATALLLPGLARADSLSIGVETDSMHLGLHIGNPPPLVVVPGTPVYSAPNLPYNYFVYRKHYYLFHEGMWLTSKHHDGPWIVIAVGQVPRPILAVPVDYYKDRPNHWKKHGPPPWAEAKGHDKERGHEKEKGHSEKGGHGKKK